MTRKPKDLILKRGSGKSGFEVSQTYNTTQLFGTKLTKSAMKKFGAKLKEEMIDRTLDGGDISGKDFEPYTKEYAEEKGVSRNDVNLKLKDKMLKTTVIEIVDGDNVRLRTKKGVESAKSYNHNVGDTLPQRLYFGFYKKDIRDIVKDIKKDAPKTERQQLSSAIDDFDLEEI